MSKTSYRRKVTSAKITDWVEPSFDNFFGNTSKVSGKKEVKQSVKNNNESLLDAKTQSKKRANPFSTEQTAINLKQTSSQSQNDPWIDKYKPEAQADLAVHKKKVEEVDTWLRAHIGQGSQKQGGSILLLTGPPGCGKTATIQVLAKDMGIQIQEWINPIMQEFKHNDETEVYDPGVRFQSVSNQSQSSLFQDFLLRANKYNKLQMIGESSGTDKKLIIVDDMPNQFYRDPSSLHDILRRFVRTGRCPLVFIISDSMSGDSHQRRLFPKEIQEELCVCNISFNPVAPTSMLKVLTRIATAEASGGGSKTVIPDKAALELLCTGCSGDIRSAINSLQFSALKDFSVPSDFWPKKKGRATVTDKMSSRGKHKKKSEVAGEKTESVQAIGGKDASLFLFRALGKILYCKPSKVSDCRLSYMMPNIRCAILTQAHANTDVELFDQAEDIAGEALPADSDAYKLPAHLSEHNRDHLLVLPESVIEKSHMNGELFNLYLHQNYLDFFSDIDDVVRATEYLSAADVLTGDWNSRATLNVYSSSVASRGIIHCNGARAFANCQTGVGFRPLHKPQWLLVFKKHQENSLAARSLFSTFCSSPLCLQTQVLPYLAMLPNPLRNQAQATFIQDVGRLPLKKHFGRLKLEALTDKDPGLPDAESDEDPTDTQGRTERDDAAKPNVIGGNGQNASLSSSQGVQSELPTSQPQPVTPQVDMEDEEMKIEEYDSD